MEAQDCKPIILELQSLIAKSEAAVSSFCTVGDDTIHCIKFSEWHNSELSRFERLLLLRMVERLDAIQVAYTNILEYFHYKFHRENE